MEILQSERERERERERRRRKILERGAHRLALITGGSSPLPSVSPDERDGEFATGTLSRDPNMPTSIDNDHGDGGSVEVPICEQTASIHTTKPVERENETSIQAEEAPVTESDALRSSGSQSSLHASTDENLSVLPSRTEERVEKETRWSRQVTVKEITSAIAETERSRLLCTILIAVLVVLSNCGFPLLGSYIIWSMIRFRPLYLVLLTNVTLVGARLLLDDRRGSERASRAELKIPITPTGEGDWVEQASKAFEASFVMQKAMDALLLDFSVYAVIVVCGLSFFRD